MYCEHNSKESLVVQTVVHSKHTRCSHYTCGGECEVLRGVCEAIERRLSVAVKCEVLRGGCVALVKSCVVFAYCTYILYRGML